MKKNQFIEFTIDKDDVYLFLKFRYNTFSYISPILILQVQDSFDFCLFVYIRNLNDSIKLCKSINSFSDNSELGQACVCQAVSANQYTYFVARHRLLSDYSLITKKKDVLKAILSKQCLFDEKLLKSIMF